MLIGLIIVFGLMLMIAGCVILANPESIFAPLRNALDRPGLQVAAVLARLTLGYLLISQAALSRFPLLIQIIGWLSVVAAITLAVVGRNNFKRLMNWALSLVKPLGRVSGAVAFSFGAFLVYSFT
ncbi:MAG: hypothetical protein KJP04_06310 [Arenicella sp.]|nr:hypothetical protein [Arenicella sp.]